jgi:hypothetical protein
MVLVPESESSRKRLETNSRPGRCFDSDGLQLSTVLSSYHKTSMTQSEVLFASPSAIPIRMKDRANASWVGASSTNRNHHGSSSSSRRRKIEEESE